MLILIVKQVNILCLGYKMRGIRRECLSVCVLGYEWKGYGMRILKRHAVHASMEIKDLPRQNYLPIHTTISFRILKHV